MIAQEVSTSVIGTFRRYEQIRKRLETATFPDESVHADALDQIADQFDAVLFDSFGVLNLGDTVIPGAPQAIADLRKRGLAVRVLTNAAAYPVTEALRKYDRFGFDFTVAEVISSRNVAAAALCKSGANGLAILCDEADALAEFNAMGERWTGTDNPSVQGFLFLSGPACLENLCNGLYAALEHKPRPIYVANPDLVAPREHGLSIEPGWVAHDMIDLYKVPTEFFGKPFTNAFEAALVGLEHIPRHRIAMVGDTLHTDILGGAAAGLRTILVTGNGIFAGLDVGPFIDTSRIRPDFILPAI